VAIAKSLETHARHHRRGPRGRPPNLLGRAPSRESCSPPKGLQEPFGSPCFTGVFSGRPCRRSSLRRSRRVGVVDQPLGAPSSLLRHEMAHQLSRPSCRDSQLGSRGTGSVLETVRVSDDGASVVVGAMTWTPSVLLADPVFRSVACSTGRVGPTLSGTANITACTGCLIFVHCSKTREHTLSASTVGVSRTASILGLAFADAFPASTRTSSKVSSTITRIGTDSANFPTLEAK